MHCFQWDVTGAFLHATIKKKIYARIRTHYGIIYVLIEKAVYGLTQSPREWGKEVKKILCGFGFNNNKIDNSLWFIRRKNKLSILICHVDDRLLYTSKIEGLQNKLNEHFKKAWNVKFLGEGKRFIGMNIRYNEKDNEYILDQEHFIADLITNFGRNIMSGNSIPMTPNFEKELANDTKELENSLFHVRSMIDKLQWLSHGTRPDITYGTNLLASHQEIVTNTECIGIKRIEKYLCST